MIKWQAFEVEYSYREVSEWERLDKSNEKLGKTVAVMGKAYETHCLIN